MKDNCFTEFCCFLSNLDMNQPLVYIYPLPFGDPVEVAGPLGTPLGLAQRKRASPRGDLVPSRDSRARTRSPSPRAWRPDFPGAEREAPLDPRSASGENPHGRLPFGPRSQASLQTAQGPGVCKLPKPPASRQSCPTLCDPIDGSPPGCPVPGILQARTLEWVAISFSNALK